MTMGSLTAAAPAKLVRVESRARVTRLIVTPEMATKWLERNDSNRPVDQSVVERYARDMRLGKWHFTGDPIQFGASGRLLNGQHRLWACIVADTPFEVNVVRGLENEEEVMRILDSGKKRTFGNALSIAGEKDCALLAAIVSTCWRYDEHRLRQTTWPSREEAFLYLAENPGIRTSTYVARMVYKGLKAQASACGAAFFINARVDAERSETFWKLASTGEGLRAGDPILAYRRWVISAVARRDKPSPNTWLAHNLKAMQQWRDERSVKLLAMKNEEISEPWAPLTYATRSKEG